MGYADKTRLTRWDMQTKQDWRDGICRQNQTDEMGYADKTRLTRWDMQTKPDWQDGICRQNQTDEMGYADKTRLTRWDMQTKPDWQDGICRQNQTDKMGYADKTRLTRWDMQTKPDWQDGICRQNQTDKMGYADKTRLTRWDMQTKTRLTESKEHTNKTESQTGLSPKHKERKKTNKMTMQVEFEVRTLRPNLPLLSASCNTWLSREEVFLPCWQGDWRRPGGMTAWRCPSSDSLHCLSDPQWLGSHWSDDYGPSCSRPADGK